MTTTITLIATAAMGLESIVAKEVRQMGYPVEVENGRIRFNAPISAIPRCNLWLRTADRLKLLVGEFEATTFDALFEATKALPWEQFISEDGKFPVSGKSIKSTLYSVPDCQAITKKAIAERLKLKYGLASKMPETGPLYKVEVSILKDKVTLTIDTSGTGLHKRGYRVGQGDAPIKETLAAALVILTRWNPDRPFVDPFCGSGTIPIEAAMIGQNIAPGTNRDFLSEEWPWMGQDVWDTARMEAEDQANYDQPLHIYGYDHNPKMIDIAKENAMEAGFADLIHWEQKDVKDLTVQGVNGVMVGNPPYGERLGELEEAESITKTLGASMKKEASWSVYMISPLENFETLYGKKATKKRKLFNGFIRTDYYQFWGKRI